MRVVVLVMRMRVVVGVVMYLAPLRHSKHFLMELFVLLLECMPLSLPLGGLR
jgi:hypothetical protein